MHFLALIPARSGSKSIKNKNIRLLAGKPLIAYSIQHALQSRHVTRTIVSTDSEQYAEIARRYGAETPFLRPAELARDLSTDLEVFVHALTWLAEHEDYHPDVCVHLRPTYPFRRPDDIDQMIDLLRQHPEADAVRSVAPAPETPFKMWFVEADGYLRPVVSEIPEAHNLPRQALPPAYLQNACIDVIRTRTLLEGRSMTGQHILGYVMDHNYDIDYEAQFAHVEEVITETVQTGIFEDDPKTFVFDIDGVIAGLEPNNQYDKSQPRQMMIEKINTLFDLGHTIILFTARGTKTGIDWSEVTRSQMAAWGVKYHQLLFGKPAADYYIDDKSLSFAQLDDVVAKLQNPGARST